MITCKLIDDEIPEMLRYLVSGEGIYFHLVIYTNERREYEVHKNDLFGELLVNLHDYRVKTVKKWIRDYCDENGYVLTK